MFFVRFEELCKNIGKSTTAIGEQLGISKSTMSYWRNNIDVLPKNAVLQKIADYFNVSTDYLLCKTDIKNPPNQQTPDEIAKVALFGGDSKVTEEMWQEVKYYVEYVKTKHFKE